MNAANRVVNRLLLFVAGIALLVVSAAAALRSASAAEVRPAWWRDVEAALNAAWGVASGWTVELGDAASIAVLPVVAVATALVVLVIAVVVMATRRRGRTHDVLDLASDAGRTVVDRQVADAVLCAPLLARPDVVSARAEGYLIRGRRTIGLAVRVQPGAALDSVLETADAAISEWDLLSGDKQPVVVHLSDRSWRDALRPKTRVR